MKKKIIKNAFKAIVLSFLFLNLASCGKGGSLRSAPPSPEIASEIDGSDRVPGGQDETGDPNGVPGGQDETGDPNGVPGGQDGTGGSNGVPGGSDGTGGSNGVPGGSDGTGDSNEISYQFSITQSVDEQKEVDILMAIDNSGSMTDNHINLGQRFGNLFNDNLQRVNWQMAFISSCFGVPADYTLAASLEIQAIPGVVLHTGINSPAFFQLQGTEDNSAHQILSPSFTNPGNIFLNTISSRQHGECSYVEFQAILNMINSPETHPQGFFREDALLAIVIVTDERDMTDVKASDIITAVKDTFGEFKQFATYGLIVEPGDIECDIQEPDVHYKIDDLVQKTGGITGSICAEDYSPIMANIGTHIEGVLAYHEVMLRHTNVVEDSIALSCSLSGNSIECPSWEPDSESNKILFDTPPEAGVKVEISYRYQP